MKNIILCALFTALIGLCNQDYDLVVFDDFDKEDNVEQDPRYSNNEDFVSIEDIKTTTNKGQFGPQGEEALHDRGSMNRVYTKEAEMSGYGSSIWDKKFSFYPGIDLEANRAIYRRDFIKSSCLIFVAILVAFALFLFIKNKRKQLKNIASKGVEKISTGAIGLINLLWYVLPLLILILIILLIILIVK